MHAVPIVAIDPSLDALRLGGLAAVVLGALVLYATIGSVLSRRGRSLTPQLGAILIGGIAVVAGYFLPWAHVDSPRVGATLFGADFGGVFGAGVLAGFAIVLFLGAGLSPLWESPGARVGLGSVTVAAGIGATIFGLQFLHPTESQVISTFVERGPDMVARTQHIPVAEAAAIVERAARAGSLEVSHSFGPYVVLAGGVLAAAASALAVVYHLRRAVTGRRRRGSLAGNRRTGRGHAGPRGRTPGVIAHPSAPRSRPAPTSPGAFTPTAPVVREGLPPPPPMPEESPRGASPTRDARWVARPPERRRGRFRHRGGDAAAPSR